MNRSRDPQAVLIRVYDEFGGYVSAEMAKVIPMTNVSLQLLRMQMLLTPIWLVTILRALQQQADAEKEPQYVPNDGSEITVEHILPQKPGEKWKHLTPKECKANYNRLSNQALLTDTINSRLGNEEYSVKKPALLASDYSPGNEAGGHSRWGLHEIASQQTRLAKLALLTWALVFK